MKQMLLLIVSILCLTFNTLAQRRLPGSEPTLTPTPEKPASTAKPTRKIPKEITNSPKNPATPLWKQYLDKAKTELDKEEYDQAEQLLLNASKEAEKFGQESQPLITCLTELVSFYYSQEKYSEARETYQKVLEISEKTLEATSPELASKRKELAQIYILEAEANLKQLAYDLSIECYKKAAEYDPVNTSTYKNKTALLYSQRGESKIRKIDYNGAISDFTLSIELDPKNALFYSQRGDAKVKKLDFETAILDYKTATEIDPKQASTYKAKIANIYSRQGLEKYNKKDFDAAITDLTNAIEIDPKNASAYVNRANTKIAKEDFDGGIADYKQAIELDPALASAYKSRVLTIYNQQSNIKAEKGDFVGAISDFDKILEFDPTNYIIYYNRATAKANKGDFNGAILDYTKAIELDSKFVSAYLGRAIMQTQLGHLLDAKKDYKSASQLDPSVKIPALVANATSNNSPVANSKPTGTVSASISIAIEGLNKAVKGDYNAAINDYSRALQLDSNNPSLYLLRGFTRENVEDYYGALLDYISAGRIGSPNVDMQNKFISVLDKIIEAEPKNFYAYTYRGFMKISLSNQDCVSDLSMAVEINPQNFTGYLYRGIYRLLIKRDFEGEKDLIQAKKIGRNNSLVSFWQIFRFYGSGGLEASGGEMFINNEMDVIRQKEPKFYRLITQIRSDSNLFEAIGRAFLVDFSNFTRKELKKDKK